MAGYTYAGTQPYKPRNQQPARGGRTPRPFNPDLCGTTAGWNQHTRHKQDRCEPCKQARKDYDAAYQARRRATK